MPGADEKPGFKRNTEIEKEYLERNQLVSLRMTFLQSR